MDAPDARANLRIQNKKGLHARASAKFVETVARFQCEVIVRKDGNEVSGRSIMGLMMLGASLGTSVEIAAVGTDAWEAVAALTRLIESKFHEDS
jgi:phosphocarrier protein HPr